MAHMSAKILKMTVAELIAMLQTFDPAAGVVVSTYDDRNDVHNVLELRLEDMRPASLRRAVSML